MFGNAQGLSKVNSSSGELVQRLRGIPSHTKLAILDQLEEPHSAMEKRSHRSKTTDSKPVSAMTISTAFAREDWEKWMNFDGQQQQFDVSTPTTLLSGSPPPLQFVSGSLGSTSPSELESLPPLQFSPTYALPTTAGKKRKSSDINGKTPSGRQPRGQKTSHNVIEKRYRSNLNDKIARLRDSVPELRIAQPTIRRRPQRPIESNSDASGDENGEGLKFNKATVLVKATEYIQQLERQNQRLQQEVSTLKNRSGSGKTLAPAVVTTGFATAIYITPQMPTLQVNGNVVEAEVKVEPTGLIKVPAEIQRLRDQVPPQPHYAPEATASKTETTTLITIPPFSEIQGMIPLPESWKTFRSQTRSDEHYAPQPAMSRIPELQVASLEDDDDEGTSWSKSRLMSRILVGSLAGLMVMEGFSESADEVNKIERRGLFSLPTELLTESRGFRDPVRRRIIAFAASPRARKVLPMMVFSFLFLLLCFGVLVYVAPSQSRVVQEDRNSKDVRQESSTRNHPTQNSIGLNVQPDITQLTLSEEYALRILDWLNLSWLVFQHHDEEAAGSNRPKRSQRWTRFLMPRTFDSTITSS